MPSSSLAKQQQISKPQIEDVMNETLDGDVLKNALDFVAYLRENKTNPRWTAKNAWWVNYKGQHLVSIRVGPKQNEPWGYGLEACSWQIAHWIDRNMWSSKLEQYEKLTNCDNFKEFIWSSLHPCKHCMSCKPGNNKTYFGRDFISICGPRVVNPDINALELTKKLLEYKKNLIAGNVAK